MCIRACLESRHICRWEKKSFVRREERKELMRNSYVTDERTPKGCSIAGEPLKLQPYRKVPVGLAAAKVCFRRYSYLTGYISYLLGRRAWNSGLRHPQRQTCLGFKQALKNILICIVSGVLLTSVVHAQTGSIWSSNRRVMQSLYADTTATQVGDLVTITVNLSTAATKDQSTQSSKVSSVNDTITSLIYPPSDGYYDWYRYRNLAPQMAWAANQAFKGGGQVNNKETLITTIQARVVEVLPNGTMHIEARRNFEAGKEKSALILSGVIRQEDLNSSNTISSNRIADLQIRQEGKGPLTRQQDKGWLVKLYEFISPF